MTQKNIQEIPGPSGALRSLADVPNGGVFKFGDRTLAKNSGGVPIDLDSGEVRADIATDAEVYLYGAFSYSANYPNSSNITAGSIVHQGGRDMLVQSDGQFLALDNFDVVTPGSAPLPVATTANLSTDP